MVKDKRPEDCIFHLPRFVAKEDNCCKLTTYAVCDPASCPWCETEEELRESYKKAAVIWMRTHGGKNDYYARGLAPLLKGGF